MMAVKLWLRKFASRKKEKTRFIELSDVDFDGDLDILIGKKPIVKHRSTLI